MNGDTFWQEVISTNKCPLVLPDIGTFFNQDMSVARKLFNDIADSGVRYIKGEILHDADVCLPGAQLEQYLDADGQPLKENYRQLIERKTVSLSHYRELFAPCNNLKLGLILSVYDIAGADFAIEIGSCALKVASTNIVHAPLIRYCAASGLPLILDTGKSTIDEVERAVNWAKEVGCNRIIVEYSPPAPPNPTDQHNLKVLTWLQQHLALPIGLSDHHSGEEMLYAATVFGCRLLEKGVCPDEQNDDQDVFHALKVSQLNEVIGKCKSIHSALGEVAKAYQTPPTRSPARMGLVASKEIKAGQVINQDNLRYAFPTLGIGIEYIDRIIGQKTCHDIQAGQPIGWQDVDT